MVDHLDVYQRTAPYFLPRNDRSLHPGRKAPFKRFPVVQPLYRAGIYGAARPRCLVSLRPNLA